ncbi:Hypothetical protein PBC10988_21430 [Planctomycetales bacterium 10988]|nr:Hypothetical protein PBC10988_21430 [Planctomycetales bacterium 10988]
MSQRPIQDIRPMIQEAFHALGVSESELDQMQDTLLIQDGRFTGRTFRAGNLMAMFMVDIGLIQVYAEHGELLKTYSTHAAPAATQPQSKAA